MPAKTSPARRAAFMAALAETGNQALATERAKVSGTWVRHHRATDPDFRRESDAALRQAQDKLKSAHSLKPVTGWGSQAGEELVVRGGGGRRVQIARARLHQWTPRVEARFLSALAACCNVRAACRAVGMTPAAAYYHYRRWPDFEKRWDDALETGYLRLDMAMLENARRAFEMPDYAPDLPMPPMDFDQAIQLLRLHQARVNDIAKRPGRVKPYKPQSSDEAFASLADKLERFERVQRARDSADPAVDPVENKRALAKGARIVRGSNAGDASRT